MLEENEGENGAVMAVLQNLMECHHLATHLLVSNYDSVKQPLSLAFSKIIETVFRKRFEAMETTDKVNTDDIIDVIESKFSTDVINNLSKIFNEITTRLEIE